MFNYLVLKMSQSVASFLTLVGQGKYYVFLICSQEKHFCCREKNQEKAGKNIKQDMHEPCCLLTLLKKERSPVPFRNVEGCLSSH